ncbi:MAG TPA: hypothetical protein DEA62_03695, partial [Coxiellaceae bacterium]|nr:hypothetical protein [Coxiellaceae bacterium]
KTEFLIPLKGLGESSKLLPITSNLEVAIDAFIKKRGSFDTLILGNGYALDAATADALGVRQVGCGMEKVTLEDLTAKGLWVDMQSSAEPDVVGDMTNSSLYLAIQKLQGPKCLTKISDRAWLQASYLDDDKVLSLIKSLLKDDGIFEILDSGFFWDGVLEDKNRVLIDKMSKVGFIYEGCDIERKALLFRPKN